jgi:hypothetical protein
MEKAWEGPAPPGSYNLDLKLKQSIERHRYFSFLLIFVIIVRYLVLGILSPPCIILSHAKRPSCERVRLTVKQIIHSVKHGLKVLFIFLAV